MNGLREAAENLPGRWYKGFYGDDEGNFCAVGHLRNAFGWDDEAGFREIGRDTLSEFHAQIRLLNEVSQEMFPERSGHNIVNFNDHPQTTEDEILSVFEKAAVKWEETHE